jgi:hypothetical protein
MPSSEVMDDFRAHKLHSGRGGKIVRKKKQAKAILLSYLCSEGKIAKKYCKGKGRKVSRGKRVQDGS